MSVSRTKRASISDWFMPAPTARITPCSRSLARAGYAPSSAACQWSSGSWISAMSIRSSPSRSRLSSIDRRTPSAGVVEDDALGPGADIEGVVAAVEALAVELVVGADRVRRPDEPADLRREHERVARHVAQHAADAPLRRAVAVQRRRVEIADADVPGAPDHRPRVIVGDRAEQAADRRAPETEPRDARARSGRAGRARRDRRPPAPS